MYYTMRTTWVLHNQLGTLLTQPDRIVASAIASRRGCDRRERSWYNQTWLYDDLVVTERIYPEGVITYGCFVIPAKKYFLALEMESLSIIFIAVLIVLFIIILLECCGCIADDTSFVLFVLVILILYLVVLTLCDDCFRRGIASILIFIIVVLLIVNLMSRYRFKKCCNN